MFDPPRQCGNSFLIQKNSQKIRGLRTTLIQAGWVGVTGSHRFRQIVNAYSGQKVI